jgi:RNA polymerase-binding protein DksA
MHTMAAWTPYRSALPDDWEERAGALGDEEVLEGLDHEARTDIESIRAAIQRLENGSYGVCVECGEPIAEARLKALPVALLCIDCAEE